MTLFNSIAASEEDRHIPLKEMNLRIKQYYSRIAGLMAAGLIKRHGGTYSLSLLGHIVYDFQMLIGKTLGYYWKLRAIESIEMSTDSILLEQEMTELINALIDNNQIKEILTKSIAVRSIDNN